MSETLGCGHPDKSRACGDCLDEAEAEVQRLELQNGELASKFEELAKANEGTLTELGKTQRLNDEYRRFCEGIVACDERDMTFWKRRAQFSLDAMKRECLCSPHPHGTVNECTEKRNSECTQCRVVNGIHEAGCVNERRKSEEYVCFDCCYKGDQVEHREFTGCASLAKKV